MDRSEYLDKADKPPEDAAALGTSGLPIPPGSTLALRAGLAGMRTQLAEAQRRDPRRSPGVCGEGPRVHTCPSRACSTGKLRRALMYRMMSDNLLVARGEGDDHSEDLPVVLDATHPSEVPGAPRKITWKHVFLGAVHNTVTGHHRTARDAR